MPTFSFPEAPPSLTEQLHRRWNAPLPLRFNIGVHRFGDMLDARLFSAQERSTSELLRTL
jgi:hypothetical protein